MLSFEVSLLTGRYVATSFNDREAAEWPPHPARLFSALVAAHFEALDPGEGERAALQWLERQGAPEIAVPEASRRDVVTVFVPVNDTSVTGSRKGKDGKEGPREAESLLPDRRKRQPRTFPSVAPEELSGEASIVFMWPGAEPPAEVRAALDGLAERVVRLGHSSSFVCVRVSSVRREPVWVPVTEEGSLGSGGLVLRVVRAGQLAALCAAFANEGQRDAPGRVLPAAFQRYVRPAPVSAVRVARGVFGADWVVLRRVQGPVERPSPRLPSVRAVDVGRTLRKALMAAHGEGAPEVLSGHRVSGEASARAHLAYVSLPFVGHPRADGGILGVALVFPREAAAEERRAVFEALRRWEEDCGVEDEDGVRVPLHMGRAGELWLSRFNEGAVQVNLRPETWCGESRSWASATPVALDRNPGDLFSSDPGKEAAAYAEAEACIAMGCERIGLPRPARVTVVPAAPLAGGDKARHFPAFKAGRPPVQRVLVHATLVFDEVVGGPILLGAGRYFGLGLFRPLGSDDGARGE